MANIRRGRHVMLPIDQLVPHPVVRKQQEIVVRELHARGRCLHVVPLGHALILPSSCRFGAKSCCAKFRRILRSGAVLCTQSAEARGMKCNRGVLQLGLLTKQRNVLGQWESTGSTAGTRRCRQGPGRPVPTSVGRHLPGWLAQIFLERGKRNRPRRNPGPCRPALAHRPVAGHAVVGGEEPLAVLCVAVRKGRLGLQCRYGQQTDDAG